jgi:hypothetical protein
LRRLEQQDQEKEQGNEGAFFFLPKQSLPLFGESHYKGYIPKGNHKKQFALGFEKGRSKKGTALRSRA